MLAVLWLTLGLPGIYGVAAALAINMAIAYGLSYLGGKLFGQDLKEAEDEPRGESFAWDPHTTHQEGIPRPVCFGRNQHHGNVVMRWSDVDPISGNEILFKALDYGGGPVQGVVGGIVSDDNKCLEGTPEFNILLDSYIDDWYQTAANVNDDDKTTYVGFHGVEGYGHVIKGRFESIVTFAEASTISKIEYFRHWYISGNGTHQGYEKVYLYYEADWHQVGVTRNITGEGEDISNVVVAVGGPWEGVTKIKIEIELRAAERWFRGYKGYSTVTYRLYELRAWRLEDIPVFLNDQPAHNFTEAIIRGRLGTLNQTCMKGFEKNKLQYAPETTIVYGEPVRWTSPNKFFDDIEFTLAWLRGLYCYSSEGKVVSHGVGVKVEISERDAEDWSTVLETTVTAHQLKALFKAYRVNELVPDTVVHGTQYDLRFSKTTEEKPPGRYGDEVQLRSVREVVDVAFTHPGRALLGVIVQATERLQGHIDVKWITDDKLVQVYNSETETWEIEYSRNRAYIDISIAAQPVISGDGTEEHPWTVERYEGLVPTRIDLAKVYEWAQWCDELVPSGVGEETEKRMPCDIICDRQTNVWSIFYEIAQIGRMSPYWQGCILTGWIDKVTTESIDLITMDNTMARSWKSAWAGHGEMAGSVEVFYKDAQQGYARKPRPVHNKNAGLYTRVIGLEGVGVTSESLATRIGNHALKRNELIKNINSVKMGREALRYRLGRIVAVQCNVPNWGQSFRVIESPTSSTVQLDRVVEDVAENDLFWVKTAHATTKVVSLNCYTVESTAGKVVTIKETWAAGRTPLKNHLVAVGTVGKIKLRRVVKMQASADNYFVVELETYDTNLFTSDDADPVLTNPDYAWPITETVEPMTRQAVIDLISSLAPPAPKISRPQLFNCDWAGDDINKVVWSKRNPDKPILLTWEGETHEITPNETTLEFVYWDSTNPTAFQTTADGDTALAAGMYLACTNKDGVEHPSDMSQTRHGAIVQPYTLSLSILADRIADYISETATKKWAAESGADVTGGKSITVLIDRIADNIAETAAKKWAAESGADVTGAHPEETISDELVIDWNMERDDVDYWKSNGTIAKDAVTAYQGVRSLKAVSQASGGSTRYTHNVPKGSSYGNPILFPVKEGQKIFYGAALYGFAASSVGIAILRYDGDRVSLGGTGAKNNGDTVGSWVNVSGTYTVTAGVAFVGVYLYAVSTGAGGNNYIDNVTLRRVELGADVTAGKSLASLIDRVADNIVETETKKWAAETGADVTAGKSLAVLINRIADNIEESAARKWAAESGADVTLSHTAANISGQGALATLNAADTPQIVDEAVTLGVSAYTDGEAGTGNAQTVEIETTGLPVTLFGTVKVTVIDIGDRWYNLRFFRDDVEIYTTGNVVIPIGNIPFMVTISFRETPPADTYSYHLHFTGSNMDVSKRFLYAQEVKK